MYKKYEDILSVKLVSHTKPSEELFYHLIANEDSDSITNLISYCARVSNPSNQDNVETAEKLLAYLIKNKHWSPFEMVNVCLEVTSTRDIVRQILRHRSFSFQEFCLSGDTEIYFAQPGKIKDGSYKPSSKYTIKELYEKWTNGAAPLPNGFRMPMKDRIGEMLIKGYNESTNQLTTFNIKDIFYTGKKELFEVTLSDGKKIKTTKEHKFLTQDGFETLEDIVGLKLIGDTYTMSKNGIVGTNGTINYQDKEWLECKKTESLFAGGGIPYIVETYGVNYNTIRKWLKKHNISYTKKEVAIISPIWNKGKFGYKLPEKSEEVRQKHRNSAKKGKDSNLWRGGGSKNRPKLDMVKALTFKREKKFKCERCESSQNLNIHHKIPVSVDPSKTNDVDNWELLCRICHVEHHKKENFPGWHSMSSSMQKAKARKENCYIPKWAKIISIEYIGIEDTYDIEVDNESHNYIANGIIVHNSQRYADPVKELEFCIREARLQDTKNRQNSIELPNIEDYDKLRMWWKKAQIENIELAKMNYNYAISQGIAKEVARVILPEGNTISRVYINGAIRSWIHYIDVRDGNGTQKEHMMVARACAEAINKVFPYIK